MAYSTIAQIQLAAGGAAKMVEVFDHDGDGLVDDAVIVELQAQVDSWIDSYAGRRYAVPMSAPSAGCQQVAAAEVVFRGKRGMVTQLDADLHKERQEWLEGISKGHVVPCDPPPAPSSLVKSTWVSRDDNEVSREKMRGAW